MRESDLERLLSGREERWDIQRCLLREAETVVQVGLNLPGLPKRVPGGSRLVEAVAARFEENLGIRASAGKTLENDAGPVVLLAFRSVQARRLKKIALSMEEASAWGRILDIDVITEEGPLSRESLKRGARPCLLCDLPAKACARLSRHSLADLREKALALLDLALKEVVTPPCDGLSPCCKDGSSTTGEPAGR
ncbi:MAG: citrate lyase holo-[acyl-carrier protein] synthase [Synergistales bacterium]|nr:citrate lyase holo-[acyl-carrier protein] synthase [Synergistales bacterium]